LPSEAQFSQNPVLHINDRVVALVASGAVQTRGAVECFSTQGCSFAADPARVEPFDLVVFCTGYQSATSDYLRGVSFPDDFSLGIFCEKNPTLVNAQGAVPIIAGSFYHSEMVARWYAQLLAGNYRLSQEELKSRVTAQQRATLGPLSALAFGLKLGLFPDPRLEFKEFWRLLNYPAFPMIFRLRGPHADPRAAERLEDFRKRAFVKTDQHDPALRELKYRILAGLALTDREQLLARGEISTEEFESARAARPLSLNWDMQFVRREDEPVAAQRARSFYERIFQRVRQGSVDPGELARMLQGSAGALDGHERPAHAAQEV